jgi:hypothetical protein
VVADDVTRLAEPDEVAGDELRALVDQLVVRVLRASIPLRAKPSRSLVGGFKNDIVHLLDA